ncbi:TPA: hypothetical protein SMS98_001324 [Pseudomonas aeruginosa]|jgi:hypothetical protein|nr:hypothetical protein [Pseudomonas aeruginosa]KEA10919.1 hypothetical protein BH77_30245 [Pseudomonas aeruginosa C2773C]EKU3791517.1 hypothetical protein [Pseudomonas aeruginosa]EKV3157837.1 hypothetical protein [Pseudomonas aeruginosa]EKX0258295.1 hypothetical protein [Pseudomonas aeruginosa]
MGALLSKAWLQACAAVLLIALGSGLVWWGLAPRIDLQTQRADAAEKAAGEAQQLVSLQAGVLAEQQRQIGQITEIDQRMRALAQAVSTNARVQGTALEELRRNDQAVDEYLRGLVPAGLGRLYERPETTDPGAYRGPTVLPAGAVRPTGTAGGAGERSVAAGPG